MKKVLIKATNKGLLHKKMGVPASKKIGTSALATEKAKAKKTGDKKLMKEVVFAQNFGHKKAKNPTAY